MLLVATQDFDVVNAMSNLVVPAVRRLDVPQCLPLRNLSHWSHCVERTAQVLDQLQAHLGAKAQSIILAVACGGAILAANDTDSMQWLKGLSVQSQAAGFDDLHNQFLKDNKIWTDNSTLACWWDRVPLCVPTSLLHSGFS